MADAAQLAAAVGRLNEQQQVIEGLNARLERMTETIESQGRALAYTYGYENL